MNIIINKVKSAFKKVPVLKSLATREMETQFFMGVCDNPERYLKVSVYFLLQYLTKKQIEYVFFRGICEDGNRIMNVSCHEMHRFMQGYYNS